MATTVKLDYVFVNMKGKEIPADDTENSPAFTLRDAMINALLAPVKDINGKEKLKRYLLATKIRDRKDEIELTSEEVVKLKELINNVYSLPLIVAQAWQQLE